MKIAIEDILTALDQAAAKTLGRQQMDLKHAGLNLLSRSEKELLKIPGSTLIIEPEVLRAGESNVEMKISIRQRNLAGETSVLLTTQLNFIRMPISKLFPEDVAENIAVFSTLSLN